MLTDAVALVCAEYVVVVWHEERSLLFVLTILSIQTHSYTDASGSERGTPHFIGGLLLLLVCCPC